MAYSNVTATSVNDALDQFHAFAVTNGWTDNDLSNDSSKYAGATFTGRRAHLQKTKGAVTAFVNMRSAEDQRVFVETLSPTAVWGIAINLSTSYDSGESWDEQPGYTNLAGDSNGGVCGAERSTGSILVTMKLSTIDCHFFAADSGNTISGMFESAENSTIYIGLSFGFTSKPYYYYSASAGGRTDGPDLDMFRYFFCRDTTQKSDFSIRFCDGTNDLERSNTWLPNLEAGDGNNLDELIHRGANTFLGNTVLVPSWMGHEDLATGRDYGMGFITGVKFVNMKFYQTLNEVTIGSDTYKFFQNTDTADHPFGVALLK